MKLTEEYIVIRRKKKGDFLKSYKNRQTTFSFDSHWSDYLQDAITVPIDVWHDDEHRYMGLCQMLDAEPIKVKAEYTLETLDGEPAEKIEVQEDPKARLMEFFETLLGGVKE